MSPAGLWPVLPAVVCALLFAGLATTLVLRHGVPLPGDVAAHAWGVAHRPPEAVALARGITATGTGPWPYVLVVIAGVIAGRTAGERLRAAVGALVVLVAGQLVRAGLMELFARARPAPADWATHASGFAFPSGHATTSALTAGLLCWAVTRRARADLARTTCPLAVVWAAAVGVTRVYLGVHWASDVIGGWLLAAAWLSLWWWGLARWLPVESTGPGGPEAPGAGTAPDASHPARPSEASGGSRPSDASGSPRSSGTSGLLRSSGTSGLLRSSGTSGLPRSSDTTGLPPSSDTTGLHSSLAAPGSPSLPGAPDVRRVCPPSSASNLSPSAGSPGRPPSLGASGPLEPKDLSVPPQPEDAPDAPASSGTVVPPLPGRVRHRPALSTNPDPSPL